MLDLLKTRRSIRKFQDKEIEQEKIDIILKGALTAPSSKSKRPWELIVLKDKELLHKISECRGGSSAFLAGAPLGIVVAADTSLTDVWTEDSSILAAYIQLIVHSLGLGSCWIQVRERSTPGGDSVDSYIKGALKIPENYSVECILAIGYPGEEKAPHIEENLPFHKIHYNHF